MNDQADYFRVDLNQYEENGFLVIPTSKDQQMVSLANQCKNLAESLIESGHKGNFQFQKVAQNEQNRPVASKNPDFFKKNIFFNFFKIFSGPNSKKWPQRFVKTCNR